MRKKKKYVSVGKKYQQGGFTVTDSNANTKDQKMPKYGHNPLSALAHKYLPNSEGDLPYYGRNGEGASTIDIIKKLPDLMSLRKWQRATLPYTDEVSDIVGEALYSRYLGIEEDVLRKYTGEIPESLKESKEELVSLPEAYEKSLYNDISYLYGYLSKFNKDKLKRRDDGFYKVPISDNYEMAEFGAYYNPDTKEVRYYDKYDLDKIPLADKILGKPFNIYGRIKPELEINMKKKKGGEIKKYQPGGEVYPDHGNPWDWDSYWGYERDYQAHYYNQYDPPEHDPTQLPGYHPPDYYNKKPPEPFKPFESIFNNPQVTGIFGQLMEGSRGEANQKQRDNFNPIQGFHGFRYQLGGDINTTGYTPGFKSFNNKYNIIPSGDITMKDTPFPVVGKSLETGEVKIMKPGQKYKFKNTKNVLEIPLDVNQGMIPEYQMGGSTGEVSPENNPFFSLQDPRNTLNYGQRKLVEIQTEKGEFISSPYGDIVKVSAKEKHKNMDDDKVTEQTAEGNYVHSDDKSMTITKEKGIGRVKGIKFDEVVMGKDNVYYEEGKLNKEVKEYKLNDIEPKKKRYTFAELTENLGKKFPVTTREKDPFAMRAQVENKQSRVPYLEKIIELSELKRPTQMSNPKSRYKKGGFAHLKSIYQPMIDSRLKQLTDNAITGTMFPEDPLMDNLNKIDNALKYNRDFTKQPTSFKNPITYQGGGPIYDDRDKGQNKREQWNWWINQAQNHFNDFTYNNTLPSLQAQSGIQALGVLGQNAYQGHNEYLYGNQYRSQLDNLANAQSRSLDSEQDYASSLVDQSNSAIRLGANAGLDPSQLTGMRSNAIRESNSMISNLGQQRRTLADRYGTLGLNATDMFAGRQNQQDAYLNDFSNNRTQNLAGIGSQFLANKNQAEAANQGAQAQFQLMEQPGSNWSDFTDGLGNVLNTLAGLASALTGLGGGGGKDGGQQQPNGTYSGYNPFGGGAGPQFGYTNPFSNPTLSGFNSPLTIQSYDPYPTSINYNRNNNPWRDVG